MTAGDRLRAMRRAFTLIELLVIVAIIATMVSVSVVSVRAGQGAARVKGATRDLFATIRHARSVALVTQKPSIITYSTEEVDGETCAKIEIVSTKILSTKDTRQVYTLSGEPVNLAAGNDGDAPADSASQTDRKRSASSNGKGDGEDGAPQEETTGQSVEDVLFAPISAEVLRGMCVKVLMGDEQLEEEKDEEVVKNKISVFSNVDYLVGRYKDAKKAAAEAEKAKEGGAEEPAPSAAHSDETQEPVSVVWEVNGRCEPHRVWIYPSGSKPESGLSIKIDRFGAAKVLASGEDE